MPNPALKISRLRCQAALLAGLLLAACTTTTGPVPAERETVPPLPAAPRYVVDPAASQVRVLAMRAGPLARFGHNHVLIAPLEGVIHAGDSSTGSGFRLSFKVADLQIDPEMARLEEGAEFSTIVSDQARKATRDNLLGKALLQAESHPVISLQSISLSGPRWNPDVKARLRIRGVERDIEFPATVFEHENALHVVAVFRIRQSDFGIEPFNILGGGLAVADELRIRVRVTARAQ